MKLIDIWLCNDPLAIESSAEKRGRFRVAQSKSYLSPDKNIFRCAESKGREGA